MVNHATAITLEKIEIADDYPADIRKTIGPKDKLLKPKRGYKYAFFLITMSKIKNIHVVSLGGRNQNSSILNCTAGESYKLSMWQAKGIRLSDLTDIRSPSEFVEGAKILLVFTILKDEKPDKLNFVYYFKNQLKDSSMKKGKIEMKL